MPKRLADRRRRWRLAERKAAVRERRDAARASRADQLAGDKTTPGDPRRPDRTEQIKTLRAELAAVKTELQESK